MLAVRLLSPSLSRIESETGAIELSRREKHASGDTTSKDGEVNQSSGEKGVMSIAPAVSTDISIDTCYERSEHSPSGKVEHDCDGSDLMTRTFFFLSLDLSLSVQPTSSESFPSS